MWDYSGFPLNIGGYICLPFSLLWGFACVAVVKLVFPLTNGLIDLIPYPVGIILASVLGALLISDAVISVLTALGLNKKLEHMDRLAKKLEAQSQKFTDTVTRVVQNAAEFCEEVGDRFTDGKIRLKEKLEKEREEKDEYEEMAKKSTLLQRRLIGAFPNMKPRKNFLHLEAIRDKIKHRNKKD